MGAILTLSTADLQKPVETMDLEIQTMMFCSKTITRLELVTALWALESFEKERKAGLPGSVVLITDCKTIADLPQRRGRLEAANFQSKRTSLPLASADLYRKFFDAYDKLYPTVTWISGHSPSGQRGELQQIFAQVDRAARKELRNYLKGRGEMVTSQTIWVLQWERYTSIAKSQSAPPEFWTEYHKIIVPRDGQITEVEIVALRKLMALFKLEL